MFGFGKKGGKQLTERASERRRAVRSGPRHVKVRAADLEPPEGADTSLELAGPSPNPHTNLAIADIALRSSTFLARRAVERLLLGKTYAPRKARAILKGRSLPQSMIHGMIARTAMRSVPGAVLVGSGLVVKTLYDRSRARRAAAKGEARLSRMAAEGEED
ncbi:hypothetical protein [Novosphingobium sp. 9]|uniref:hypothetical protein n=1 Tax=Novosphingobium sp. 9 TaxID=2025349 RepID=UPI0021B6D75F|nr:hypothetical protein [Novosphingobium sp. 9]